MRAGYTVERLVDEAPNRRPIPLEEHEVRTIYAEVKKRWREKLGEEVESARAEQVERLRARMSDVLRGTVVLYRGQPVMIPDVNSPTGSTPFRKVDIGAYVAVEREYSAVMGTHAPTKLRFVDDKGDGVDGLGEVLSNLGSGRFEKILEEQKKREELAEVGLRVINGGKASSGS
jgi:hypothetical protein